MSTTKEALELALFWARQRLVSLRELSKTRALTWPEESEADALGKLIQDLARAVSALETDPGPKAVQLSCSICSMPDGTLVRQVVALGADGRGMWRLCDNESGNSIWEELPELPRPMRRGA